MPDKTINRILSFFGLGDEKNDYYDSDDYYYSELELENGETWPMILG